MPIGFVLDEHLGRPLWQTVQLHNARGIDPIDVTRVGNPISLPLSTQDPQLLLWCEEHGRILVSHDTNSLPLHLLNHLQSGRHLPGLFLIRPLSTFTRVVNFLVLVTYASDDGEWTDRIEYI